MKRVIVKSVLITLCLLITLSAASVAVITARFPMIAADVAFKVDSKQTCLQFTEKAYLLSNDVDDLALLTERCIWANDNEKTIKYAEALISDDNYNQLLSKKDSGYAYYIASEYVIALYQNGYVEKAIDAAFKLTNGFKKVGPVHRLIALCAENSDGATLIAIKEKLRLYDNESALYLISVIDDALTSASI